MSDAGSERAVDRVWRSLLPDPRSALERHLDPSDLNTLLMAMMRVRAAAITPAWLLRRWQQDRYVRPSTTDPRRIWRVEARLWDLLPETFSRLDLSPVTPLGTCSAVAPVDQHRVISTVRGTEVVSDPTNVLALEAALCRKQRPTETVHLAACHRVVRAQPFLGEGMFQHFRLMALLSSGRDRGSGSTEASMLTLHLRYWIDAVTDIAPDADMRVELTSFGSPVLTERFRDTVLEAVRPLPPRVSVAEDLTRERARGYYGAGALRIVLEGSPGGGEIGDGGFTDWTAALMADRKERCLISCISTERLAAVSPP